MIRVEHTSLFKRALQREKSGGKKMALALSLQLLDVKFD